MSKLSFDGFGFRAQNTLLSQVLVKNAIKIHVEFQIAYFCTKHLLLYNTYFDFDVIMFFHKRTKCGHTEKYAKMQQNIQFQN